MRDEPKKAYVYQPLPPQKDGRAYAVGGLHVFGLGDDFYIDRITKECAAFIVRTLNNSPETAVTFAKEFKESLVAGRVFSNCGCRFGDDNSNSVLLCDVCSRLPCHDPQSSPAGMMKTKGSVQFLTTNHPEKVLGMVNW